MHIGICDFRGCVRVYAFNLRLCLVVCTLAPVMADNGLAERNFLLALAGGNTFFDFQRRVKSDFSFINGLYRSIVEFGCIAVSGS